MIEWDRNDPKAKSDIILSITSSEWKQIKNYITSHDMWNKLREIYKSQGPALNATLLKKLMLQKYQKTETF